MDILNKKQKIIIIGIGILMLAFIGYYIINKTNKSEYIALTMEENQKMQNNIEDQENLNKDEIRKNIVHVTGAVREQGIVEVEEGARISDVIDAAGGTTNEADLTKINLAYTVEDGQKIYVPNIKDEVSVESVTKEAGENVVEENSVETSKVNINTASQTELETLSGIGPSTALKIINYREQNGKFEKIEDIKVVPGIGDAKFESLKDSICVQ